MWSASAVVNISNFSIKKVLDKQSGLPSARYKCELEWRSSKWEAMLFRVMRTDSHG